MFGRKEKPKPITVTSLLQAQDLLLHNHGESILPSLTYILDHLYSTPTIALTFPYKLVALIVQRGLYGGANDEEERVKKSDALRQKMALCILIHLYHHNESIILLTRDTHDLPLVVQKPEEGHERFCGLQVYSRVITWMMKTLADCCALETTLSSHEKQVVMLCWRLLEALPMPYITAILCNSTYSKILKLCTLIVSTDLRAICITSLGTLILPSWEYINDDGA